VNSTRKLAAILAAGMSRRKFITFLGGVAVAWPVIVAQAQQGGRTWRVGHVLAGRPDSFGHIAAAFDTKLELLDMAQAWAKLADQAKKNCRLVYETPVQHPQPAP